MISRPVLFLIACFTAWSTQAQLVLDPTGLVELPAGQWADTVLIPYDPLEPVGSMHRLDQNGEMRTVHMVLKDHPAAMLQRLLGMSAGAEPVHGTLYFKVNRLRFSERGKSSQCDLHAEVLERSIDGFLRRFESTATARSIRCDDGMACHERDLENALRSFFDAYTLATLLDAPVDPSARFTVTPANTPMLDVRKPARGLFRSFMDMRMNMPDTTLNMEIRREDQEPASAERLKLKNMPDSILDELWGLSNGHYLYIREGTEFHRLYPMDSGYYASIQFPATVDPAAVVGGGLLFGAIGGGVMWALSSDPGPRVLFDLDMLTGGLVLRDRSMISNSYAQHIFCLSRFAEPGTTVKTSCERGGDRILGQGQWTSFSLSPKFGDDHVVLSNGANEVVVNIQTNSDLAHVHLVSVKKDGSLKVTELKGQMRQTTLKDLEAKDRVR
jgi:hypothetical protein